MIDLLAQRERLGQRPRLGTADAHAPGGHRRPATVSPGRVQLRHLGTALGEVLGKLRRRGTGAGNVTPFQAVATALASTVGVGNIAGVATAIALGGPGALFWLWVSGLLGMATKYAEIVIALHYRERDANGTMRGGAMYT